MSEEMMNVILNAQDTVAEKTPYKKLGEKEHLLALRAGKQLWIESMKLLSGKENTAFISRAGENWTIYSSKINAYKNEPVGTEITISNHSNHTETSDGETINYISEKNYFITQKGIFKEIRNWAESEESEEPRPAKEKHVIKEELERKEILEMVKKLKEAESVGPLHNKNVYLELSETDKELANLRKELKNPFKRFINAFRRRFSY